MEGDNMKEYDKVELISDKKKFTDMGLEKGRIGTVLGEKRNGSKTSPSNNEKKSHKHRSHALLHSCGCRSGIHYIQISFRSYAALPPRCEHGSARICACKQA